MEDLDSQSNKEEGLAAVHAEEDSEAGAEEGEALETEGVVDVGVSMTTLEAGEEVAVTGKVTGSREVAGVVVVGAEVAEGQRLA